MAITIFNKQSKPIKTKFKFSFSNEIIPDNLFNTKKNNAIFDSSKMSLYFFFIF